MSWANHYIDELKNGETPPLYACAAFSLGKWGNYEAFVVQKN
jgi:hypothetical protein